MSPLEGLPEPPAGTEPERVYHYTDAGGLLGIVKNKGLWASNVWFMNDAREAEYGLDVIERVLISRTLAPGAESEVCRKAADLIRSVRDQNDLLRSYIACLSKEGDQLSQWRAYGRPRGFSIGFDRVSLRRLYPLVPQLNQPIYRDVSYDETEQDNNIAIRLNTALERLPTTPSGGDLDQAASAFVMDALLLVPAFKDPAFEEEREVRLQIFHLPSSGANDLLCFRNGAMGLTPYVEVDLRDPGTDQMTVLREVIVGPQPNQKEAQRAVKQLLGCYGMESVEVRPSKIPLRP